VWYLKCRALTLKNWIDDAEVEEEVRRPFPDGRLPRARSRERLARFRFHQREDENTREVTLSVDR